MPEEVTFFQHAHIRTVPMPDVLRLRAKSGLLILDGKMADSPPAPAFRRLGPDLAVSPVLLSVPHAGRLYSDSLIKAARVPLARLETLEDRLVDRLVWRAVDSGSVAIVAEAPRAEIDLNRDERELDPGMIVPRPDASAIVDSPRTRGGLGLVPARMSGAGPIWRERIPAADIARRIDKIHRPYHAALAKELAALRARFGVAILLDCHSMPPRSDGRQAQIVLGDRHGSSMTAEFVAAAESAVRDAGFTVARNAPYAGGHITAVHGRPREAIHALQLEIDRSLYLGPDLRTPGPGFDRVSALVAAIVDALATQARAPAAVAAE
jgi:N-formylglutamate amidohydrolase